MAILVANIFNDKLKLAWCPGVCLLAPKHVSSDNFLNSNTHIVNINKVFVGRNATTCKILGKTQHFERSAFVES